MSIWQIQYDVSPPSVPTLLYPTQTHSLSSLSFSFLYLLLLSPLVLFSDSFFCSASLPTPVFSFFPSFSRSFVLTLFIFKAPNYVLARTLTERVV